MKVFIMVDIEGISGIINSAQGLPGNPDYNEGRRYMTWDVNACVEGCIAGGASEIVVRDAHYMGRNLIWEELFPKAEYLIGKMGKSRMPGVADCDAVILLGYHSMAGTPGGILEHTMSPEGWQNFWVNGRLHGEFGIDAALAGCHDKPVIMVSGDDKVCAEAESFVPGIFKAQVKSGLTRFGGRLLSKDAAHELIRTKAAEAVKNYKNIKPYKVPGPVTMRLELVSWHDVPSAEDKPYMKIIDGRTFEVTGDTFDQAWYRLSGR